MEIRRCEKGHFYDAEANSTCPQCAAEAMGGAEGVGATMPVGGEDYVGATIPVGTGVPEGYGATEPIGGNFQAAPPTPSEGIFTDNAFSQGNMGVQNYEDATQPVTVGGVAGFSPATGWLVCTEGPAKGTDYRVRAGYNYIGRGEHMDICVRGDQKIGRERHALIAYDQEEKVFFFGPADGKSIVRLNGKMVMSPMEIHAYDVVSIGDSKLMFVPLCGERFDWDEE
jgi:hypothetical protein